MSITIDLPPAIVHEAEAYAQSRKITIERMVADCFDAEIRRLRERKIEKENWLKGLDELVKRTSASLPGSEPYKFNRADAYPEDVFA